MIFIYGVVFVHITQKGAQPNITTVLPCRAFIPRYFYNDTAQQCEMFIYGGCDGNDNNFETAAECRQNCSGIYLKNPKSLSYIHSKLFGGCYVLVLYICTNLVLFRVS